MNNIDTNIDPEIFEQIKNSLSNPTSYVRNTKKVSKIYWTWDNAETSTELTYADGNIEKRNTDTTPTSAAHDVAHFIACFNGNMEWDYKQTINHLCEYNAVAIEHTLVKICHNIMHSIDSDYETESQQVFDHLKWFSNDYYKICQKHPSKKDHMQLFEDFLNTWDVDKTIKAFDIFYYAWSIQRHVGSPDFKLKVTMKNPLDYSNERVYNHTHKLKEMLLRFI